MPDNTSQKKQKTGDNDERDKEDVASSGDEKEDIEQEVDQTIDAPTTATTATTTSTTVSAADDVARFILYRPKFKRAPL
jgi:hypothetical protein